MTAPLSDAEIEALIEWPTEPQRWNDDDPNFYCLGCRARVSVTPTRLADAEHDADCRIARRNACLLELRSARKTAPVELSQHAGVNERLSPELEHAIRKSVKLRRAMSASEVSYLLSEIDALRLDAPVDRTNGICRDGQDDSP